MIGRVLAYGDNYSLIEKIYIWILGMPINGLRIRARRVLPLVDKRCKNVLDVGCGEGVFTFEMAKILESGTVTGIDIDKDVLARNGRLKDKLGLSKCSFKFGDILKFEDKNKYDLVVTVDNLEHIEDDVGALRQMYESSVPGGKLIVHVPGWDRRWPFFGWKDNFEVEGHVRQGYKIEHIVDKVKSVGYQVDSAYYTYGWFETITNNISYWITGAREKNKVLYALAFPFLLFVSWFGKNSRPKRGAGVLVQARKPEA
jgi:SAM-dependent methyltransferase